MATPHVSGALALSLSVDADVEPDVVEAALLETARKPEGVPAEKDDRYGFGIVDAVASARLEGTVVDEDGDPSENAGVTVGVRSTTTDANGSYGLLVAPDDRRVPAADGYATNETTLRLDAHETVRHDVTRSGFRRGRR